ncbi:MAG: hypothetical protein B7X58_15560, partial [Marinobacter sp. 34-60-7]
RHALCGATLNGQSFIILVYRYFLANPAAITVAVRELHGSSPVMRNALEAQLEASAREMTDDTLQRGLVAGVSAEVVHEISGMTIRYILFRAMDYLEKPAQREKIQLETENFILRQFRGAMLDNVPEATIHRLLKQIS